MGESLGQAFVVEAVTGAGGNAAAASVTRAKPQALQKGATEMRGLNHGHAMFIYFANPEKNTIEVYLDTPRYVSQPHGDALSRNLRLSPSDGP